MKYNINVKTTDIKYDTYNDILNLYDYIFFIYNKSSIKDLEYVLYADVSIGDIKARDLPKESFIEEALGSSSIILDSIYFIAKETKLKHKLMLFVSSLCVDKISVRSDEKKLLDEFKRIIEDNPIEMFNNKDSKENLAGNVVNINGSIVNSNLAIGNSQQNHQSIEVDSQVLQSVKGKSWFEKYWIPIIIAVIGAIGMIIAAIVSSN